MAEKTGGKIKHCVCGSDYQDRLYGKGNRVFVVAPKKSDACTVCGRKG